MVLKVNELSKTYVSGFEALKAISLQVKRGEILALLGPNGAGKTTLISTICGITKPSSGSVAIDGYDISKNFREARKLVGLVPQDITLEPFEKVINTIKFSRGLFGKQKDDALIEKILDKLSLWEKRDSRIMELSLGMKRRVLIAKALSHQPRLLFLDEPTAGVDVELRQSLWNVVADLKKDGVTIILTTHYIEEAEAIADRVGIINKGELLLIEDKASLMNRLGQKVIKIDLQKSLQKLPKELDKKSVKLSDDGMRLTYVYDTKQKRTGITKLLSELSQGECSVNLQAVKAIYVFEMARFFRTLLQSFVSPVISTSLYFVVFGTAIGSRIQEVEGITYGAFIVPGLIMLSVMTQATSNGSFGIYFPKFIGTIYELLSAPINYFEIVLGYVGAAATKALFIGLVILATAAIFVELKIMYPIAMILFLVLTCTSFSLLGFILGIWARNFEQLQLVPLLVVTPLVFLGGSFYSVSMLPPIWQKITLFNPVVYLISGFRWSFFGNADVPILTSLFAISFFTLICILIVAWIFKTGWRIKQ